MILCLGFIPRVHLYMYIAPIYFYNKTNYLPRAFISAAVIQIIITYVMVLFFGLWGAAWAALISKIIVAYFVYLASRKVFKFRINVKKQLQLPIIYILIMILIDQFISNHHHMLGYSLSVAVGTVTVLFVFRKEIKALFESIFKTSEAGENSVSSSL